MFTYHLSQNEKEALLQLVGYLTVSDGVISEPERQFVLELAHDLNVSAENAFKNVDRQTLEALCAPFERKSARRVALVELIDLALSDNDYFPQEKATVAEIAEAMKIPQQDVTHIEDWVRRGKAWHAEGHLLLGLSGQQKMDV